MTEKKKNDRKKKKGALRPPSPFHMCSLRFCSGRGISREEEEEKEEDIWFAKEPVLPHGAEQDCGDSSRHPVWSGAVVFLHLVIPLHSLLGQPLFNCSLQTAQGLEEIRAVGQDPSGNGERREAYKEELEQRDSIWLETFNVGEGCLLDSTYIRNLRTIHTLLSLTHQRSTVLGK